MLLACGTIAPKNMTIRPFPNLEVSASLWWKFCKNCTMDSPWQNFYSKIWKNFAPLGPYCHTFAAIMVTFGRPSMPHFTLIGAACHPFWGEKPANRALSNLNKWQFCRLTRWLDVLNCNGPVHSYLLPHVSLTFRQEGNNVASITFTCLHHGYTVIHALTGEG